MFEPEGGPARQFDALFVRISAQLEAYIARLLQSRYVGGVSARDLVHSTFVNLRGDPLWMSRAEAEEDRKRYIMRAAYYCTMSALRRQGLAPLPPADYDELLEHVSP